MVKRGVIVVAAAVLGVTLGGASTPALAMLSPSAAPSPLAVQAIPPTYLVLYQDAARTCHGLPWQVLAAIGEMESNDGRSAAPSVHGPTGYGGAEGPMQFEPATFGAYAVRADRRHALSPFDPADAIYTAARMLCAAGAGTPDSAGLAQAIFTYNHAWWYVNQVMALAAQYSGPAARPLPSPSPSPSASPTPSPSPARKAVPVARPAPARGASESPSAPAEDLSTQPSASTPAPDISVVGLATPPAPAPSRAPGSPAPSSAASR
jgi:hypothetical protein